MGVKCIERPVLQEIWFFFGFGHKHLVSRFFKAIDLPEVIIWGHGWVNLMIII
jgi:hypothetical protein